MNPPETTGQSAPLLMRLHSPDRNRLELLALMPAASAPDSESLRAVLKTHYPAENKLRFEEATDSETALRWSAKSRVHTSTGSFKSRDGQQLVRFTEESRLWRLAAAPGWLCLVAVAVYGWMMITQREPAALFAIVIFAAFALLFFRQRDKLQAKKTEEIRALVLQMIPGETAASDS